MKKLAVTIGIIVLVIVGIVVPALWGSHGGLIAIVAGQTGTSAKPAPAASGASTVLAVQAKVDTGTVVATLPAEYLSFSIDLSQVVGGKWWNPNADTKESGSGTVNTPVFDFNRPRLDALARGLSPAYLRIGGSESDKAYYDLGADGTAGKIPAGYKSVMTRAEWDAVNAFAHRNDLNIVFTLNAGPASRLPDGSWNSRNAAALMEYSASRGYQVSVWELGNELNLFWFVHGLKAQVGVNRYVSDLLLLKTLSAKVSPGALVAGQGSAFWPVLGEPLGLFFGFMPGYLVKGGSVVDQISWHYYPQQSRRGAIASRRASATRLLDPGNLDEAGYWADKVRAWRDSYAPGKPIWLGETGNAQYGGEPGVSDVYIAGLWWLDELGLLAKKGESVVVRQTLSGVDYGMIDDAALEPRPDYWNSLLWKRLMGRRVFPAAVSGNRDGKVRIYAQATAGRESDAVTVLVINLDNKRSADIAFPGFGNRGFVTYALSAPDVLGKTLLLNGAALAMGADFALPELRGEAHPPTRVPSVALPPLGYAFVVFSLKEGTP